MKKPGVGYAAAHRPCPSVWQHQDGSRAVTTTIREDSHPFGEHGGGPAAMGSIGAPMDALSGRYHGGQRFATSLQPQGLWGDMYQINVECARLWFADQPKAHRDQYDGVVTLEDMYDVASANPRRNGAFYGEYWFSRLDGGRPETAIVIDEDSWRTYGWLVEQEGWGPGIHSAPNRLGYGIFYDVHWLPEGVEVPVDPPVDPPPPPPDPKPPPPDPKPVPPTRRFSMPEVRALELWEMVEEIFRRARPIPGFVIRLRQEAKPFVLPLLPDLVRIKRRLAGQPEEGSP